MRHVDDAHQPEAQREPHGGENVDRRDAEAVEDLSDEESGVHMVWPVQALSPPGRGRSCLETQAIVQTFPGKASLRSEEHTSELQSLMRISYAVFCLKKKNNNLSTNS